MSLKWEGDFSGIGGKRQGSSHQTSVPALLSGPDRGVCLLEDDPDLLQLQHDRRSRMQLSVTSCTPLVMLVRTSHTASHFRAHSRVDSSHFLTLPLLSLFLHETLTKSLIILCYMVNYWAWWGIIAGIVIISFKVWRTWQKKCQGPLSELFFSHCWLMLMFWRHQLYIFILFELMWF